MWTIIASGLARKNEIYYNRRYVDNPLKGYLNILTSSSLGHPVGSGLRLTHLLVLGVL